MLIGNVISYRQSVQDDYSKSKSKARKKKKDILYAKTAGSILVF